MYSVEHVQCGGMHSVGYVQCGVCTVCGVHSVGCVQYEVCTVWGCLDQCLCYMMT